MRSRFSLLLSLLVLLGAHAQGDTPADPKHPKLSVTGSATVTVEPDVGKIYESVTASKPSVAEACGLAANTTDAVIKAGEESGPGVTVTTTNINVQPNVTYDVDGKQTTSGFICTQSLLLTVEPKEEGELDAGISAALQATLAAGGDLLQVSSMESDLSAALRRTATNQAREVAVADAEETAGVLAKAAKVTLGEILSISDSNVAPNPPMPLARETAGVANDAVAPPPIQTGTTDVTAVVSIEYAISAEDAQAA